MSEEKKPRKRMTTQRMVEELKDAIQASMVAAMQEVMKQPSPQAEIVSEPAPPPPPPPAAGISMKHQQEMERILNGPPPISSSETPDYASGANDAISLNPRTLGRMVGSQIDGRLQTAAPDIHDIQNHAAQINQLEVKLEAMEELIRRLMTTVGQHEIRLEQVQPAQAGLIV